MSDGVSMSLRPPRAAFADGGKKDGFTDEEEGAGLLSTGGDSAAPPPGAVTVAAASPPKSAAAAANEIVLWTFLLCVASITMTVGNKYVMREWGAANVLTLMQNGAAVAYLGAGRVLGFVEMKAFSGQQWRVFAVSAFFLAMQILTSLMALPLVAIATVVTFRNMCTVIIALIDYFFFGTRFSGKMMLSLGLTTVGMIIYSSRDVNFNAAGYLWLLANSAATVFNTFWQKVYVTKYTRELKIQTSFGVSFIQQVETLPLVFCLALANDEASKVPEMMVLPGVTKLILLATCAGGILIGIAYPKCYSLMSGTSVVVASTANKAVSILLGMYLFGTILLPTQVFGLLVCVGGSLWYAVEGKKK